MSLLNCELFQRGRVSRVADTELVLVTGTVILAANFYAATYYEHEWYRIINNTAFS